MAFHSMFHTNATNEQPLLSISADSMIKLTHKQKKNVSTFFVSHRIHVWYIYLP